MGLKNRKKIMITLPFELSEWIDKQSKLEHRAKTNLIEKIIIEYKKNIEEE